MSSNNEISDIFNDLGEETTSTPETKAPVAPASTEPANPELDAELGPVDDSYYPVDTTPIKRFEMGTKRIEGTDQTEEDPDSIVAFVDIRESFAGGLAEEKHILIRNNEQDNKVIDHVFGTRFGIHNFETLKKMTNPAMFQKVQDAIAEKNKELAKQGQKPIELQVPIYRASFDAEYTDKQTGDTTTEIKTFYKFTNRHKQAEFNTYSEWYKENGGFPSVPDAFLNKEVDPTTNSIKGRILSTNNNVKFKRFEIEFEPVLDEPSATYQKHVEEKGIHSYLAFYKYADKVDENKIDGDKRSRQAGKICSALGVQDFTEWDSVVGEVRDFVIRSYNSQKGSGMVFRASLK